MGPWRMESWQYYSKKRELQMINFFRRYMTDEDSPIEEAVELEDKPVCKDNEVYSVKDASQFSIVGHHNISAKKWDVIPWAEKLYYNL